MFASRTARAQERSGGTCLALGFVLIPGFSLQALSSFVDTVRVAVGEEHSTAAPVCTWAVMGEDLQPIRSGSGVSVHPDRALCDALAFDYVVVVGGGSAVVPISPRLQQYLQATLKAGVRIAEVCTGSFLLARLGLMQGKRCSVSWQHRKELQARFASIEVRSDQDFVVDSNILSCEGGNSVVLLASHLLRQHCGVALAQKATWTMLEQNSAGAQDQALPAQIFPLRTRNRHVCHAISVMERNLATPVTAAFVAKHVGVTMRHLQRLFMKELGISPAMFSNRLRMDYAHSRLLNSDESVTDIALQSGFVSPSHFSQTFRAHFGLSPTAMRGLEARTF